MFFGDDFVEEVRQRNDIVDIISSCVNLKRAGSNYVGLCPFHNEKTPSFSVSAGKQMYYCFGCGAGGNVITFVMEYENLTFVEAVQYLAERAGMSLPEQVNSGEEKRKRDLREQILEVYKQAARFYYAVLKTDHGREAHEYLTNRGLTEETITQFGLGYSHKFGGLYPYMKKKGYSDELLKKTGLFTYDEKRGAYDKFWNRVMFPILDRNKRVIAFGGRVMGDGLPKYLNSPETLIFDKSRNLYGLNFVHGKMDKGMIICEGYMDVISLHQAGFTNAVASLGTAFTSQHASLLKRYTQTVYLCYDSDNAGVKAALRAIPILKETGLTVRVINMNPHKDPDEFIKALGRESFEERIEKAKNSFFFEIDHMEKSYNMNDPEEKTKFMNEAAKKCLMFENELERNNYIEAFARQYAIRATDFTKLVNRMGASMVGMDFRRNSERRRESKGDDDRDNGLLQAQRLMLTWFSNDPSLFQKLEGIIEKDDFTEEPYHKVAEMMYEQYEQEASVNPARIISCFESREEQSLVASLFNTNIKKTDKTSDDSSEEETEKEKALNDVVKRIRMYRLDEKSRSITDINELSKLIQEKKKLETMHISF